MHSVVIQLMSYYDHRANYAPKWSWIGLMKGCRNSVLYIGGTILSTRQWVILGMELEYQALGTDNRHSIR